MTAVKTRKFSSSRWLAIAASVVMLAAPAIVSAQDKEKNKPEKAQPVQKRPEQHPQSHPAQPATATSSTTGGHKTGSQTLQHQTTSQESKPATHTLSRPTELTTRHPEAKTQGSQTVHTTTAGSGNQPSSGKPTLSQTPASGTKQPQTKTPGTQTGHPATAGSGNQPSLGTPTLSHSPASGTIQPPTRTTGTQTGHPTTAGSGNQPSSGNPQVQGNPSGQQNAPYQGNRPNAATAGERGGEGKRFGTGGGATSAAGSAHPANSDTGMRFGRGAERTAITRTPSGGAIHRDADGRVREVHTPSGAVIRYQPMGVRHVEVVRPGGRVIVARGAGEGYVQRPVVYRGSELVQRTYYVHGAAYVRVYHPYHWGGLVLHVYTPVHYYPLGFYSWAYRPWGRPIRYSWAWLGTPWFAFYGGYFRPYPVYESPVFWLTDFVFAATLEAAYQDRMAAAAAASTPPAATPLTPEVKQAIADEVQRQLEMERTQQAGAAPQALFGGGDQHIFVVANSLEVPSSRGACVVTEGDVLQLSGSPDPNATNADVVVLASKGGDCRKDSLVSVALADLQEMQNHMRETIDQGLGDLRSRQGQSGIPALPAAAAGPVTDAPFAGEVKPDANAAQEIQQQAQEADRAEQDVLNEGRSEASSNTAGPVTISLGQTIEEVVALLGQPQTTAHLGTKQIYVYKSLKITFVDGKVTDVQ